jgi:1-acyl-sn-glycerol-3-phosphate acyltransferase
MVAIPLVVLQIKLPNWRALAMFGWTLIWSMIGILAMIADPRGKLFSFLARKCWSPQTLWIGGVSVTVRGDERIDWSRPYVICANHQSQIDIPLLFAHLPTGIRFLAKRALFYIPIFGWMLAIARFIPVDRGNSEKARRLIDRSALRMKKGPSLLVFPEGTRSPDGRVHPFKSGGFILGIKAGVPILPVAIRGTYDLVSKHHLNSRPGKVEVIIGSPIETDRLDLTARNAIKEQTFRAIVAMHETGLPVLQKELERK